MVVYGVLTNLVQLENVGWVRTVGVEIYWDINCTQRVTEIDWGMVEPGTNKTVLMYVLNPGTVNITLSANTSAWQPINASSFLSLTSNYTGQTIQFYEVLPVTLTLTVSPDIRGIREFSFLITVEAVEQ